MSEEQKTLYERLGGYDAIAAVANDLLPRLRNDPQLGRFWKNRAEDSIMREKQLLIDFLCANAGGPMYYRGRTCSCRIAGWASTKATGTSFSAMRPRRLRNLRCRMRNNATWSRS